MLAVWAGHKSESNPQRGPLVLQQLHDAIRVEDVAAGELGAVLSAQLLGVADCAQFFLILTLVDALGLGVDPLRALGAFSLCLFDVIDSNFLYRRDFNPFFFALGYSL